jgi:nucleotide-binding universal stress UspA family protein
MKKILVPIDFSAASKNASQYAAALAMEVDAKVNLLHVNTISSSPSTLKNWKKLENEMKRTAEQGAVDLMEEIRYPVKIDYHLASGYPLDKVVGEFVKDNKQDLVVVGTHGASGLKKSFIGSNAAAVINTATVPVLAIPTRARFKGINHILYATSMVRLDEEIKVVARFAKKFNALITVVHVSMKNIKGRDHRNLVSILSRMAGYKQINFAAVEGEDVTDGVLKVCKEIKPDVIAMFTHELSLYEKIFGKGITRNLAFETSIPLLSFKQK